MSATSARVRFRLALAFFIAGLLISGITAFPLLHEVRLLVAAFGITEANAAGGHTGIAWWLLTVKFGLEDMYARYPWIAYGTDWLAFGHIVIALFLIHPLLRPEQSRPALYAGTAACILVLPLALVCGAIRGIPFSWRLIDCAFGIIGLVLLLYCLRLLRQIAPVQK